MLDTLTQFFQSQLFFTIIVFGIPVAFLLFKKSEKRRAIKKWKKIYQIAKHIEAFEKIYKDINGFELSKKARAAKDAMDYVYGEIDFLSFIALLSLVNPNKNSVFYDLGCGTGKAVLACAMVFPVRQSVGVELFPELYASCNQALDNLKSQGSYTDASQSISFILGDFLEVDLHDASIIFINSSAFFGPTWEQLIIKLKQLPHIQSIITTSKALPESDFMLISTTKIQMSWGVVAVFIHKPKIFSANLVENIE